jgi:8-oxo-dGTP pyrophosphatase MutT (NUDIX family)
MFYQLAKRCQLRPRYYFLAIGREVTISNGPDSLKAMVREISAGGVVVERGANGWRMAAIEPQKEPSGSKAGKKRSQKVILALPKGLVDPGEKAEQTAVREVREETGLTASVVGKLVDTKYVYVRTWGDGERVFKIVSFYLLRYESGTIDDVTEAMRVEVKRALWIPLEEAPKKLAYRGEREAAQRAIEYLKAHPEI